MKKKLGLLLSMAITVSAVAGPVNIYVPIVRVPTPVRTVRATTPVRLGTTTRITSSPNSGLPVWCPLFVLWSTSRNRTVEQPKEPIKTNEVWRLEAPTKAEIKAAIEKRKKAKEALKGADHE